MKPTLLTIITVVSAIVAVNTSAADIDPMTRLIFKGRTPGISALASRAGEDADSVGEEQAPYIPLILQIASDEVIDSLDSLGVIVYNRREDMAIASIPKDSLDQVLCLGGIINVAAKADITSCLDEARPFSRVDAVQSGLKLPKGYDGSGVVVGFSDIGFDSKHIAFKDRVGAIYNYDTPYGLAQSVTTPEQLEQWVTDRPDNFHATHVGNILAGGYKGNGYYGAAPGAEIVATTSSLHDVGILAGVEDIIAYAARRGKRAVINLSLASYLGPHDGTDLMCRYLESCARDAVICISAGNNGTVSGFARKDLSQGAAQVTVNSRLTWDGYDVYGYTDIWSDTDAPFEVSIGVYDIDTGEVVYRTPWAAPCDSLLIDTETDPIWGEYMAGVVYMESGVSTLNGRYNATVMYDTHTEPPAEGHTWSRYYNAIMVRQPEDSQRPVSVNIFADASYSFIGGFGGTVTGSQCSINNMCTAKGVISVGNACSRREVPIVGGEPRVWDITVGEMDRHSSYSDVPNVERLPLFSAPGSYIVSALSTPYYRLNPDTPVSAECVIGDVPYYWYATCGTSMSSPLVAGIIALWLEACPTLTTDEIIDIACQTARRDFSDINDPRWGTGCIDAAAGMEEVLRRASLPLISEDWYDVNVTADRHLVLHGCDVNDIRLFTASGVQTSPHSALAPGIYIVRHNKLGNKKIIVR